MGDCKEENFSYTSVYSEEQEKLIHEEFSRTSGDCYLEHAGATLYSEKQIANIFTELSTNIYANPHARNKSSKFTEDIVDQIRFRILQHFNTDPDEYSVIFTSGATAALKLVAETFQYGTNGTFVYLRDNHTSVLGMREYAPSTVALDRRKAFDVFEHSCEKPSKNDSACNSLFVYPAESNFSGSKYPLSWIKQSQDGLLNCVKGVPQNTKWFCMLDAACFAATDFLDLDKYKPDFVCMSFYKIFGYPCGLGALLVRNSSSKVLEKTYFGGGTVLMALTEERTHVLRPTLHERFEDGTIPFLSIIALRHGFEVFQRLSITMHDIAKHTFNLACYVFHALKNFSHANGEPVAILYHDGNFKSIKQQGAIVNFNLLRPNGRHIGFSEVLHVANLYGIHLRTGCFCNPGACQRHLNLSTEDVKYHFNSGHVCGDQYDLIDGYPTGSVRISFGYMSTKQDADAFLCMINEYFVSKPIMHNNPMCNHKTGITASDMKIREIDGPTEYQGILKQIFVYPVKSCAPFMVKKDWKIVKTGLEYDRKWMIVNSNGVAVTQKTDTRLALIKPQILLSQDLLQLSYEDFPNVTVPLNIVQDTIIPTFKQQSKICCDRIQGLDCGDEVAEWLEEVLGIPGLRLLQQSSNEDESVRRHKKDNSVQLSLSNEAQFLLINLASIQWLLDHITEEEDFDRSIENIVARFRPNFVSDFEQPFIENSLNKLRISELEFRNQGPCTRCQMICINQFTGEKTVEPLRTLSKVFNGKINFGVYLNNISSKKCSVLYKNAQMFCSAKSLNKLKQ